MPADRINGTTHHATISLIVVGWGLLAAFVGVVAYLGDINRNVRLFQASYAVGFVGYGLLVYCVRRGRVSGGWGVWLVGCVVLRLALLNTAPSDDLNRYLWEGRVQLAGHNPFSVSPDDPSLASLRDENWEQINHRDYVTIYPPLAQAEFLAVAATAPSLLAMKVVHVVFDILAVALLAAWLPKAGKPQQAAIVYALCPLTLTAFAVEGHVDALMLVCLAGAGLAFAHRRSYLCGALLGAAILAKLLPIVLLPWLVRKNVRAALVSLGVVVVGYLPYASAGSGIFESLVRFVSTTQMLGLAHSVLNLMFNAGVVRWSCAVVLVSIIGWYTWRPGPLEVVGHVAFGAVIILGPIVHFWYLTWALLFSAFGRGVSWLVLSGCMVFYFEAAGQRSLTGEWRFPEWAPLAIYAPFAVVWTLERLERPTAVTASSRES